MVGYTCVVYYHACLKCHASTAATSPLFFRTLLREFFPDPITLCSYRALCLPLSSTNHFWICWLVSLLNQTRSSTRSGKVFLQRPLVDSVFTCSWDALYTIISSCAFSGVLWVLINCYLLHCCLDNKQPCPKRVSEDNDEEGPLFSFPHWLLLDRCLKPTTPVLCILKILTCTLFPWYRK